MRSLFTRAGKRLFDVSAAAIGLGVAAMPLLAVAAAIKLDSPGPIFYRGVRVGRGGRDFRIFKFRSMVVHPTGATSTSDDDARITRVGRFIRRYKLDELPQLINVLIGDMSIVGPRPEVRRFVDMYTEEEKAILTVRPGITDRASAKFHNEGEILKASGIADPDEAYVRLIRPEKLRLQLEYARTYSVLGDLAIIGETITQLFGSRIAVTPPSQVRSNGASSYVHGMAQ